ncbi:MAG: peptidylprolyl isomerase [Peptococcaceae bacterium]|jgi:parvulin-like peptidyl-prolyl isomerase|nr:peptidylprolyl isomerase [Peptococcaceae bacterium]
MKTKRSLTWTLLVLIFSLLLTLSGCADGEGFAVKVNGKPVPMEDYVEKLKAVKDYFSNQGLDLTTPEAAATLKSVQFEVLESLISSELISQEVEKNNWDLNDPEVEKQVEELKAQVPDGDYEKWLQEQGMTEKEVLEYFAFTHFISKDVTVTEEEVREFFDAHLAYYGGQDEQVKASHILLETEEEALEVIEQLKGGADFAELAKEKSIEPAAATTGGDLGYFTRNQMVVEFADAAFSQKVGTFSEKPVQSDFGFHVILVEDYKEAVIPDFEKVKANVERDALLFAKNQKVVSYYSEIREKSEIEYAKGLDPELE